MPSTTHFFILSYDSATKQWSHDYDKEEEIFPDGTIYGPEADQWSGGYLGDGAYNNVDTNLCQKITKVIEKLNK